MKKQWISVKCGLSRDPKHRQAMGESIWLFLHILDVASWEDGIAHDWKDEAEAEEMGMPVRTLREHRRRLDELGYIDCKQKQYTQDIVIHNWTNPREYGGKVYNKVQSDTESEASTSQGDTQGYIQGSRKDVTPTLDSNIKESKEDFSFTAKEKPIHAGIEQSIWDGRPTTQEDIDATNGTQAVAWKGRDTLRADQFELADWYHSTTGQVMATKGAVKAWWKALSDWKEEGLTVSDLQEAYTARSKWRTVADPNELTKDAAAIHRLPKSASAPVREPGKGFYA